MTVLPGSSRSLVSSCGNPVGGILTLLSSTLSPLFLSAHWSTFHLREKHRPPRDVINAPGRHPPIDKHWHLPVSVPSWWESLLPSLQCSSSSCALSLLHSSFLRSCPHSTTHCPSYCIWDFPFYCPLTMNNLSNPFLPWPTVFRVHTFSFPTHTTSIPWMETQWLLQDHQ